MDAPAGQTVAAASANNNDNTAPTANPNGPDTQRSRGSISSLLFLALLFILFGGGSRGDDLLTRQQLHDSLQSLVDQQANFSAYLRNETSNFTLTQQDAHLDPVIQYFLPPSAYARPYQPSYYRNITGFLNGETRFVNLSSVTNSTLDPLAHALLQAVNLTEAAGRRGDWDWQAGNRVQFSVLESRPADNHTINMIHGKVDLFDKAADRTIRFTVDGVHFPLNGSFYGFVEARGRHSELRQIPSLVPADVRNETGQAVNAELLQRIDRLKAIITSGILPETEGTDDSLVTSCPFILHAQIHPSALSQRQMEEVEEEMNRPTGITTARRPVLLMDAVLVSPECGILLHIDSAKGLMSQRYWRKTINYAGVAALVYFALLVALVREIGRCQTPAMLSRIGRGMLIVQMCLDAFAFTAHMTFAIVADNRASLPLIAPGFIACILLMFQMQFSNNIYEVQGPEHPSPSPPPTRPAGAGSAPAAEALAIEAEQAPLMQRLKTLALRTIETLREFSGAFWLLISLGCGIWLLFDTLRASNFMVRLAHYVFWLPQIVRNVRRNMRMGLSWEYVLTVSAGRLFFAMYIFACPSNVLGVEPQAWASYLPWAFAVQLLILAAQDYLGPVFFLPRGWVSDDAYDYHPLLPQPDSEAPEQSLGDCSICMDAILLENDAAKSSLLAGAAVKRSYALAPCHHLFHTQCLERWLDIKNICPQCRRPLPPL
ncbi:hypothetical protein EXIGLDRAFT_727063 [Exidia glandulosa HHB12029]|uniref:RING-type E3 ubiquitin transferase n=1 Tax=Exidia glandulosa HHB12029 TaxID=1314781 RepID=A0A165M404_EXIGL|nr:hypothetical protein EXIGLDRAFT_727063 [Exidia glandulosa HHB12029]